LAKIACLFFVFQKLNNDLKKFSHGKINFPRHNLVHIFNTIGMTMSDLVRGNWQGGIALNTKFKVKKSKPIGLLDRK